MAHQTNELGYSELRRKCDPEFFGFKHTGELSTLQEVIGQDRAVKAITFGIEIESPGYHLYALGPSGTGKTTTIRKFLERKNKDKPTPDDWLYVNNFENSDKPRAIRLPPGEGCKFENDISDLVEDLGNEIPRAFETEDYEKEQEKIQEKFQEQRSGLFSELERRAVEKDLRLLQTPRGIALAPTRQGEMLSPEEFNQLSKEKQEKIEKDQAALQEELRDTIREVQNLQQQAKQEIKKLDQQVVGYAVAHLIDQLKEQYGKYESIVDFLEKVRQDILASVEDIKQAKAAEEAQEQMPILMMQRRQKPEFEKYRVNLIVDHCQTAGAPVILESNPTYPNLIGRIEHQAQFGALVTNFRMIKGGALHQANGGYLMVDVMDILTKPLAWEGLKRALKDREIKIESMYEAFGAISTRTLEPEPIPLDIKVILLGNPMLYYLLYNMDEDFRELFKVKADFAVQMDWDEGGLQQYAQFIGTLCEEEGLRHFEPLGVARVIEQSARMVSHRNKLATKFGDIVDLVRQSSYWAGEAGHEYVQAADVRKAIEEEIYRSNRIEELLQEMIDEETLLIDTEGRVVGQVNGISVLPLGDYTFGKPTRITAQTYVGKGGVTNIDRESELGGRIHNKGVLILSGFLGGRYAQERPQAFSASITFEQLYEEVEGDSASSAELYALLSSLSGYAIRQEMAVTGSVNQRGQVQAIGGVNEKIEGFFKTCKLKGLTGSQGVIIPRSNVKHLMLQEEVVEAVKEGQFHIYPIETIDEGIEILTGVEAGEVDERGNYPENTINNAVQARLKSLAAKVKDFNVIERSTQDGRSEERQGERVN